MKTDRAATEHRVPRSPRSVSESCDAHRGDVFGQIPAQPRVAKPKAGLCRDRLIRGCARLTIVNMRQRDALGFRATIGSYRASIAVSEQLLVIVMHLQQIRYFLVLCEELNFTRAARRCGVSQPSLTDSIKRLETEFGGELFARRPKVAVTRLGRAIGPYLERVARDIQEALDCARSLTTGAGGRGIRAS